MHKAGEQNPGGMMAVLGAEKSAVEELCAETNVEISNFNAPGQIVISGINADLAKARDTVPSKGIKKIVPLNVSGAFHSRWMLSASEGLKNYMPISIFANPKIPVISNVDSNPLPNVQGIRDELITQVIKPVQWQRSIENMVAYGVNTFVEIGHGQVIAGLIRRISPEVKVFNISDTNIEAQLKELQDYVYNT
jgi:[acyl-carrier-protein] S-malonyltransferase